MEKIALVNCCLPLQPNKLLGPPQSSLYLASALTQKGRPITVYDTAVDLKPSNFTPEGLCEYLRYIPERIIGISLWDSVIPKVVLAIKKLKLSCPEKVIIIGGPSASTVGSNLICHFPWIDYAVTGEGELVLDNLVSWIESKDHGIFNKLSSRVFVRVKSQVINGEKVIPNLGAETIPILDYSIASRSKYNKAEIITTRGCPYTCSFCSVNNAWGNGIRSHSVEHVFEEIEVLFQQESLDCLHILDDNFGTDKARFNNFVNRFSQDYPNKQWSCYFRIGDMDRRTVDLMTNAGCCGVYVGIESGSNDNLNEIGKGIYKRDIIERVRYTADKMNVTASLIWGFPGETYEQFQQTLELIDTLLEFENVFVNFYQLTPLTGTRILEKLKGRLVFDKDYVSGFIYPPYVAPLTDEEQSLIHKYPEIFSAFYHEGSSGFENKFLAVHDFLGIRKQSII